MGNYFTEEEVTVAGILGGAGLGLYIASLLAQDFLSGPDNPWYLTLSINLLGYATVLLPGYLALRYIRPTGYLDRGIGKCAAIIKLFFKEKEESVEESVKAEKEQEQEDKKEKNLFQDAGRLIFCAAGLQISYLTWGILQEKIMTKEYTDSTGAQGRFSDAQFLVFVNRILAFAVALVAIMLYKQPQHKAPLYKYSYCSFSNIMSSWCQYEALKYVSFPTQVLAKASKVIPVMLMGKVVSNKKYEVYEYTVAVLISVGMAFFFFGKDSAKDSDKVTTMSGIIIMVGYMAFDSFTSNWQGALFKEYKMSSIQMMAGVNLFSCLLTAVSLAQQGVFITSLLFMSQFPRFVSDCVVLSLCSACGQLFIYHTISAFGPVVFVIIMTVRQVLAVILSCIIYLHPITLVSCFGIAIVFSALFLKIYCGYKVKARKRVTATGGTLKV